MAGVLRLVAQIEGLKILVQMGGSEESNLVRRSGGSKEGMNWRDALIQLNVY